MDNNSKPQTIKEELEVLFNKSFNSGEIKSSTAESLLDEINRRIGSVDSSIEGFIDDKKQRDLSLKFHWGHNHDFGNGVVYSGLMGNRHIDILSRFVGEFGLPMNLTGKKVLDIGVWTGGTSLLLVAMGAQVVALEEVVKYADVVNLLATRFGLQSQLKCLPVGLYDAMPMFADTFDYIIYSGVLYHVSDPLLSLRLTFSSLKNDGKCFIETLGYPSPDSICLYEGPAITHKDGSSRVNLNRGGWNYFIPTPSCLATWCYDVGFQKVETSEVDTESRILASAHRTELSDFCRAGFSLPRCR